MSETTSRVPERLDDPSPYIEDQQPAFEPGAFRTKVVPLVTIVMVLGLLGLLAYSLFAPDDLRGGEPGRISASGALVFDEPRQADDFSVETFDGGMFRLSDQRGKIVVINFWASWCEPCRDEMPLLMTADGALGDDIVLLGIDTWNDQEVDARAFVDEFGADYPIVRDADGVIAVDFGVSGVPETFVLDAEGKIVARLIGPVTSLQQLRDMVAEAR